MTSRLDAQWQSMLKQHALRNAPAELSRGCADADAPPVVYRGRVFEVRADGSIVVETPRQALTDKAFGNGDDIDLLLMHRSERLIATCTIRETLIYKVNAAVRLTCYILSPGRRPKREQRRSFFRVSVAAIELKPAELVSLDEEHPLEFKARLSNISGGGIGVSVRGARKVLNQIKRSRQLRCNAWIGEDHRIQAPVRIAHVSALGDDGLYLGLQFDHTDPAEARQLEQVMQQRCTEVQRMQLQRRRA
ncbi:MAG: PilZ domain-containing protein [Phycisphaeraceae bacterium]